MITEQGSMGKRFLRIWKNRFAVMQLYSFTGMFEKKRNKT